MCNSDRYVFSGRRGRRPLPIHHFPGEGEDMRCCSFTFPRGGWATREPNRPLHHFVVPMSRDVEGAVPYQFIIFPESFATYVIKRLAGIALSDKSQNSFELREFFGENPLK